MSNHPLLAALQVSHILINAAGFAVDFEGLLSRMRLCMSTACSACERRLWTGTYMRFVQKWVREMKDRQAASLAIYGEIQGFQHQGQFQAVIRAVEVYLQD